MLHIARFWDVLPGFGHPPWCKESGIPSENTGISLTTAQVMRDESIATGRAGVTVVEEKSNPVLGDSLSTEFASETYAKRSWSILHNCACEEFDNADRTAADDPIFFPDDLLV